MRPHNMQPLGKRLSGQHGRCAEAMGGFAGDFCGETTVNFGVNSGVDFGWILGGKR